MSKIEDLERDIVKRVNFRHATKFKLADLMEWSTSPVEAQEGEVLYEASGYYCAFKAPKAPKGTADGGDDGTI